MDIQHYFLGDNMLVVTVEHGEMEPRSRIDTQANYYAINQFKMRQHEGDKLNLFLSNRESKASGDNVVSIFTYENAQKAPRRT